MKDLTWEKRRMENILEAFSGYLRGNTCIDILWSDKIGFFRIGVEDGMEMEYFQRIESVDGMLDVLLFELTSDVWARKVESGDENDRLTTAETDEVCRRMETFLSTLFEDRQYCLDYLEQRKRTGL